MVITIRVSDQLASSFKEDIANSRYGAASDKCVDLIRMNDYRGVKGLYEIKSAQTSRGIPTCYVDFLLQQFEPEFLKRRVLYPLGFDEGQAYRSLAEEFPENSLMSLVRDVHFNEHPLILMERIVSKAKETGLSGNERDFIQQFGRGMGLSDNDINFFF